MRIFAAVLLLAMTLSAFTGCSSTEKNDFANEVTTSATDTGYNSTEKNDFANEVTTSATDTQSPDKAAEVSIGSVMIVSGANEYKPHEEALFGLDDGLFFDAIRKQPQDIAGELNSILFEEGMQVAIEGGNRWGNQSFLLFRNDESEWVQVYLRQYGFDVNGEEAVFEDPPGFLDGSTEPGEYILEIMISWQNGLEGADLSYIGISYSFKLIVSAMACELNTLFS